MPPSDGEGVDDRDSPKDCRYSTDHEWAKISGTQATVGITKFAVEQLGDIMTVSIDVKAGDTIAGGKAFGTIESVKALRMSLPHACGDECAIVDD